MPGDPLGTLAQAGQSVGRLFGIGGGAPKTDIPKAPDVEAVGREPGQAMIEGLRETERLEQAARKQDQTRALEEGERVLEGSEELVSDIEDVRTDVDVDKMLLRGQINDQKQEIQDIPRQVKNEFADIHEQFGTEATASLGRADVQREEALAGVFEGQSAAMQAAVQGIQGNINTQVAQIQSNPNLTEAQRASMIAQVQMQGASSMAPAIGETILSFNELAANTAVSFGQISGGLEATILQTSGGILEAGGNAFASAQLAVGQMTNELITLQANSDVAYTAAQNQLLTTRAMAENNANQVMTQLLPMQNTPYLDITGSLSAQYSLDMELMYADFSMQLQEAGLDLQLEAFNESNSPLGNLMEFGFAVFEAFMPG